MGLYNPEKHQLVTDSGVTLQLMPVSSFLIKQAIELVPMPKVPVIFDEDKQREEENPNDPEYINSVAAANFARTIKTMDLFLSYGAQVVHPMPESYTGPKFEDEDWAEDIEAVSGITVPTNKRLRFAFWLRTFIIKDSEALDMMQKIAPLSGLVSEEAVDSAAAMFQPTEGRDTSESIPATEQS